MHNSLTDPLWGEIAGLLHRMAEAKTLASSSWNHEVANSERFISLAADAHYGGDDAFLSYSCSLYLNHHLWKSEPRHSYQGSRMAAPLLRQGGYERLIVLEE